MEIYCGEDEVLTDVVEQQRRAAVFWFVQVDAAAGVGEVGEVDGGRA